MNVVINKTEHLQGVIVPPGSKSQAIRALLIALLCKGQSHIHQVPDSDDIHDAIQVCEALGAHIQRQDDTLILTSQGIPFHDVKSHIHTSNSGVTTRFLLPLLGLRAHPEQPIQVDCGAQMRTRPIAGLCQALTSLGMHFDSDHFPMRISGSLSGGKITLADVPSQFISALLIALPLAQHDSEIHVNHLAAKPYVDMTLACLTRHNIRYKQHDNHFMTPGKQRYSACEYTVPGDFSSASYFIAAGLILKGEITIKGLDFQDQQADKTLINIVQAMGATLHITDDTIQINGAQTLHGIDIDANDIPDLLPTLAVLGTYATGTTRILNVPQARLKETDRIHSMAEGLQAMGADIEEQTDGLVIQESRLRGNIVKGYGDHRTVMALTLAGMLAEGQTLISDAESIDKTYPGYFDEMIRLGANIEVQHE